MHCPTILTALVAALSLTPGIHAWTQDRDGVWVANNNYYTIGSRRVHEACTYMNTNNVHRSGDHCAYFANSQGLITHGFKLC
ncbi:hypothetical protein VTL71DRAFT_2795 [Oculimacula yallundae]|uniref:Uncharacterized protein n=1 Tax=Oculimacula yallundae TaxID=86028 RepID=A0ABR4C9W2_9HELO